MNICENQGIHGYVQANKQSLVSTITESVGIPHLNIGTCAVEAVNMCGITHVLNIFKGSATGECWDGKVHLCHREVPTGLLM